MKIKLYESKWENKIKGELAHNFYDSIMAGDIEGVKSSSENLINKCKDFFDQDEEEYIFNDIESLLVGFEEADEEDIDDMLNELYDFCDNYLILIDVKEEPEDAEVFVDDSKNSGDSIKIEKEPEEQEESEIEPVEVEEVSEEE